MPLYESERDSFLRKFRKLREIPDVDGVALVTRDGLNLIFSLPEAVDPARHNTIAASLAAATSIASKLIGTVKRQTLEQIYIKGQHGYVILMEVGDEAILVVLAGEKAKLGLLFLNMGSALNSGDYDSPLAAAPDPIFPPKPPKKLTGHARPE